MFPISLLHTKTESLQYYIAIELMKSTDRSSYPATFPFCVIVWWPPIPHGQISSSFSYPYPWFVRSFPLPSKYLLSCLVESPLSLLSSGLYLLTHLLNIFCRWSWVPVAYSVLVNKLLYGTLTLLVNIL